MTDIMLYLIATFVKALPWLLELAALFLSIRW